MLSHVLCKDDIVAQLKVSVVKSINLLALSLCCYL